MPFEDLAEHIAETFGVDHWRMAAAIERWCFVRAEWRRDYLREYQRRPERKQARREYHRRPDVRRAEREYQSRPERRQARRDARARLDAEIAAIRAAAPRWNPPPPAPFTPRKLAR